MIYLVQLLPSAMAFGTGTYTEHLARGMGDRAKVVRVLRENGADKKPRVFANGCEYLNVSMDVFDEMLKEEPGPILLCAVTNMHPRSSEVADYLMRCRGAWFVYHDYLNTKEMTYDVEKSDKVIVIREANLKACPKAKFIPHPYERHLAKTLRLALRHRETWALSHARMDFAKRTYIIMEANVLLPASRRVVFRCMENRFYAKHVIQRKFPDWQVGSAVPFPREHGAAAELCSSAVLDVDMTFVKGDGRGTQYTSLEAMDAGTIPVIAKDWGPVPFSAIAVEPSGEALMRRLAAEPEWDTWEEMAAENIKYLERVHDARKVADAYCETLT